MRKDVLIVLALLAMPRIAAAQEAEAEADAMDEPERGTLIFNLRGGGYVRADDGYLAHAQTFGFDRIDRAGGGALEAGVQTAPRIWLFASYSGFESHAERRLSKLELRSDAILAHVRYAVWSWRSHPRYPWLYLNPQPGHLILQLQASLGAGLYRLHESLDEATRDASAFGLRVGGDFLLHWHWFGFVLGYAYHHTGAQVADRLGGTLSAGGHEISLGLSLRF